MQIFLVIFLVAERVGFEVFKGWVRCMAVMSSTPLALILRCIRVRAHKCTRLTKSEALRAY